MARITPGESAQIYPCLNLTNLRVNQTPCNSEIYYFSNSLGSDYTRKLEREKVFCVHLIYLMQKNTGNSANQRNYRQESVQHQAKPWHSFHHQARAPFSAQTLKHLPPNAHSLSVPRFHLCAWHFPL